MHKSLHIDVNVSRRTPLPRHRWYNSSNENIVRVVVVVFLVDPSVELRGDGVVVVRWVVWRAVVEVDVVDVVVGSSVVVL